MCIIVAKKKGVELPKEETLKRCFNNNDDGAGFMYLSPDGEVFIRKGFMAWEEFKEVHDKHKFTKDDIVVYHFRIATIGKVSPENTHPFPLSKKLEDLKNTSIECEVGIAHNGTVPTYGDKKKDISDIQEFVQKILSSNKFKKRIKTRQLKKIYGRISSFSSSKFCILDKRGLIIIGSGWIKQKDTNILFSNNTYSYDKKLYLPSVVGRYDANWNKDISQPKRGHWYYSEKTRIRDLREILEDFLIEFLCEYEDAYSYDLALEKAFKKAKDMLTPTDTAYNRISQKLAALIYKKYKKESK